MCGRFTLTEDRGVVARRFGAPPAHGGGTAPRFNIAPTQLVVTVTDDGARQIEPMRWGLIPHWAKDPKIGNKLINARAETLAEKPSFREALKKRRCLIPADGFYEWHNVGGKKQPLRIVLKDRQPFAFTGLWDEWRPLDGSPAVRTCTIITCAPNELMAQVHHRMPVILPPEREAAWLDPRETNTDALLSLLVPYPADQMEIYRVSALVNSPESDVVQCALPLE
ncbi:MAG TPA: SOS response-associated peptidase [Chloroflexota bacterium]|nr:SOS response-associated peptidase [Chloroflexota bacterium]